MRDLRSIGGTRGEPDLHLAVDENLGRPARRPRQREGGGKRRWRWRFVHVGSSWMRGNDLFWLAWRQGDVKSTRTPGTRDGTTRDAIDWREGKPRVPCACDQARKVLGFPRGRVKR